MTKKTILFEITKLFLKSGMEIYQMIKMYKYYIMQMVDYGKKGHVISIYKSQDMIAGFKTYEQITLIKP